MRSLRHPTLEEFSAFWKDYDAITFRQFIPLITYVGGLVLYALVVPRVDAAGCLWFLWLPGALAYLILAPCFWIRWVHTRYARFIRCPECGDWFGWDSSGAYHGTNPKFRIVMQTGKCGRCGTQILAQP